MKMFWCCKHDWEVKDKEIRRPPVEPILAAGLTLKTISGSAVDGVLHGTVVWLVQCKKCSKIKTIKETL